MLRLTSKLPLRSVPLLRSFTTPFTTPSTPKYPQQYDMDKWDESLPASPLDHVDLEEVLDWEVRSHEPRDEQANARGSSDAS